MYQLVFVFIFLIILFYSFKNYSRELKKEKKIKVKKYKERKRVIKEIIYDNKPKEDLVYLEITSNDKILGKIIIKLFSKIVPRTCNNFRTLCKNKNNLTYINSPFHRIIKDFMIQGGDFTKGDGTGGLSIYGDRFEDENFFYKHDRPYLLSMANAGPNTNGSQFFITTSETPHLDNKHVVFGEVTKGFHIVDYLNNVETNEEDRPRDKIYISDCGIL